MRMNILVCFKYIYDEDELFVKPDRTIDLTGAPWVVSPYDLNTIEASMKLAAAVGDSNVYMLTVGGEVLDNSTLLQVFPIRYPFFTFCHTSL